MKGGDQWGLGAELLVVAFSDSGCQSTVEVSANGKKPTTALRVENGCVLSDDKDHAGMKENNFYVGQADQMSSCHFYWYRAISRRTIMDLT